jgi:hypothetical protein
MVHYIDVFCSGALYRWVLFWLPSQIYFVTLTHIDHNYNRNNFQYMILVKMHSNLYNHLT